MDVVGLLGSEAAKLPKTRAADDFVSALGEIFARYRTLTEQLDAHDYVTQQVAARRPALNSLCEGIARAVREYERGLPHRAFDEFKRAIEAVRPEFDRLCQPHDVNSAPELGQLYRIRTAGPEGASFERRDLFHIPFEQRHKVARQRYSLPGLPCLYLGATLYICWEELGRPNFDSIYFARFAPQRDRKLRFLDFGLAPAGIAAKILPDDNRFKGPSNESEFAVAYAVCWPLLAACSVRRRFDAAPFVAEYIAPQLVLQWATETGEIDGIRYLSVRVTPQDRNAGLACNFVFPAREFLPEGHCPVLKEMFAMSSPLSWQLTAGSQMPDGIQVGRPHFGGARVAFVGDHSLQYQHTPFGVVEAKAVNYPTAPI